MSVGNDVGQGPPGRELLADLLARLEAIQMRLQLVRRHLRPGLRRLEHIAIVPHLFQNFGLDREDCQHHLLFLRRSFLGLLF